MASKKRTKRKVTCIIFSIALIAIAVFGFKAYNWAMGIGLRNKESFF